MSTTFESADKYSCFMLFIYIFTKVAKLRSTENIVVAMLTLIGFLMMWLQWYLQPTAKNMR